MAVVVLAVDGKGLGPPIRSTIVSNALASVGERPVVFSEGKYQSAGLTQFPVRFVPSLWDVADGVRKQVASELLSMAAISLPAVVVDDTHPPPIQLPSLIRRVLLVRPASLEYLIRVNEQYDTVYSVFLLCDSPDSPTWPYDEAQTRQLSNWKKWHTIGPIYRRPSDDEIREVRTRYRISSDQEVCVFTVGGDGVHVRDPGDQDVIRFLRLASQVADVVQPAGSHVRLLLVQGPYFPARIPIPSRFEVVQEEEQMPALLKIAKGAVIHAGCNTAWDCLAAGTPFIPLNGTTYAEPATERVSRLASLGLVAPNIEQFWFDNSWRAEYRRIAKTVVATHSGVPEPRELARLTLDRQRLRATPKSKLHAEPPSPVKRGIPLVIRIDDAVCKEPAFCWLLDLLASRGMRASLEVVPYLLEFDQGFLDGFDPSGTLFEVSQHGYAHVPRTSVKGLRCEFSPESDAPTEEEFEAIGRGKREIEKAFPKRFSGGFSPPFDALPPWLPAAWYARGGTFVSSLSTNSVPAAPLPVRRAGVDVWDWSTDRALNRDHVMHKLALQVAVDGHAGIVLHPRCLRNRQDKLGLVSLLNYLQKGVATVSLRDLALGKVEAATSDSGARWIWGSFGEKLLQRSRTKLQR